MSNEIKKQTIYRHKKSGALYLVLDNMAKVQINDVWYDAIIYCIYNSENDLKFIRTAEEFKQSFEEIKCNIG